MPKASLKTTPTKVPAIPRPGSTSTSQNVSINALAEAVDVGLGRRGDPVDRFVTVRDLQNAGLASTKNDGSGGISAGTSVGGQVGVDTPGSINGLPDNTPPDYGTNDYTPPPTPTGVAIKSVAPNNLMVIWNPPAYGNHAYTEVYLISPDQSQTSSLSFAQFLAVSPGFNQTKVCTGTTGTNPNVWYRGKADGSNATIALTAAELNNGGSTLGAAVNPPTWFAFVRFVSLAGIAGPFGPAGNAATGQPSIDPLRVLDLLMADVKASNAYTNLTAFLGADPAAVGAGGGVSGVYTTTTDNKNSLNQLYTVRAGTTLPNGNIIAAGFGLGITVDNQTGVATSLFAVDADQFAIMGGNGTYTPISSFSRIDAQNGTFSVPNSTPDIVSAFNAANAANSTTSCVVVIKSATGASDPFDGVEATVTAINGSRITCMINTPADQTTLNSWPSFSTSKGTKYITLATNIPFIVDTTTSTVGIRGKLVVDGLVRATSGDFDNLTAGTAFINSLRAGIVNANLVCGQRIIAGAGIPDTFVEDGAIDDESLSTLDAWIVELSTPGPGEFPLQIYNPKRQAQPGGVLMQVFGGDPRSNTLPYMYVNGDFRLGGNATLNLRQGGAVAMGVKSADGLAYTFWCGADSDYATPAAQMEGNGFFWIRPSTLAEQKITGSTAQGGFNLDLFLGKNALAIPSITSTNNPGCSFSINQNGDHKNSTINSSSLVQTATSNSTINIRSLKGGANAPTVIMVSGFLVSYYGDNTTTDSGNSKMFTISADLVDANGNVVQNIQNMVIDDWAPETFPFMLQNIVTVGAGNYRVKLTVVRIDDRSMTICQGWNCVAFQGATNGALA